MTVRGSPAAGTAAAIFATSLLGGCSGGPTATVAAKGGDGTLRLSLAVEPARLNPNVKPLDESSLYIAHNIYSRLVALADDGYVLPELAERWDVSHDGRTYTFHLRRSVTWHDGRALTARDVHYTFSRIAESSNEELARRIARVELLDRYRVAIHLTAPWAAFLTTLGWYGTAILPEHIHGAAPWEGHPANRQPIGSGPFQFVRWDPGERIVLAAYQGYFGQGPYVDGVEYIFTADESEAAARLRDGDVHLMLGRPPVERLAELEAAPRVRVQTAASDGRTYIAFNLHRAPFDRRDVRRAVNMALDRRAIVTTVLSGLGTASSGFYTPQVAWAYNAAARVPPHDPAAARRILGAAARSAPSLTFLVPSTGASPAVAHEVVRQLRAADFDVRPLVVTPLEYLERVTVHRDFDMALLAGRHGPDPEALAMRFGSRGALQVMGYANAELDAELARGSEQSQPEARVRAYMRAQEILAADLPVAPLYESVQVMAFQEGVRGLAQVDARGLVAPHVFNLVRLPGQGR